MGSFQASQTHGMLPTLACLIQMHSRRESLRSWRNVMKTLPRWKQTLAQEAADQETFDSDMQSHSIEKAKRSKEAEMKANEKKRLVSKINSLTKTKKHVSDELEATQQY